MIVGGVKCRSCSVDQGIAVTKVLSYQKNFREKFGFSADRTVAETQKAFAALVGAGSFPESVWKRLAQLLEQYNSRAVSLNRLGGDERFTPDAKSTQVSQSQVPCLSR